MPEPLRGLADIKAYRVREWKERRAQKHGHYKILSGKPDTSKAPEPTDADINWPEPMFSVSWGTGYITITTGALEKLPAKQRNEMMKLGGLKL